MRTGHGVAAVLAAALALGGCAKAGDPAGGNGLPTAAPSARPGQLRVVAAESLWGDIAAQIGGSHVAVTSIISDPAQDPHEYESGVGDAAAVHGSKLVIVNGAGYDPFMQRLLGADPDSSRRVVTASSVVHAPSGANPHLWYDPDTVLRVATAIEQALTALQPSARASFAAGRAAFAAGMQRVTGLIARIRAAHAGTEVGYTEPVPGYLVRAAGLVLGTPAGFSTALENGTDPSPGDSAHFEQDITGRRIAALLLNTQVSDPETSRLAGLARAHGVPVVDVSETLPRHTHFQTWQADQAAALLRALGG